MDTSLYRKIITGIRKSAALENYLNKNNDPQMLQLKTAHDIQLFGLLKTAAIDLSQLKPLGKGLLGGIGAAVPITAGGAYLINRAGDKAKEVSADARNKALQAALGVGAVGAGLYGLHRLTSPKKENKAADEKQASADEIAEKLLEKLATVGYLDTVLQTQEKNANAAIRDDAHDCRMLNAEYGVELLKELLK